MAPRKAELLDLMRKQRAAEQQSSAERTQSSPQKSALAEKPKPPPRETKAPSSTTRPVRSSTPAAARGGRPTRLPWTGIGLVLLIAIPMVYWLSGVFGAGEMKAGPGPPVTGSSDASGVPADAATTFGVVAIQYDLNPARLEEAKQHGLRLMQLLQSSCDLVEEPNAKWIRIYLGLSTSAKDPGLLDLRERLIRLEYPAGSGAFPFASAYIARFPAIPE